MLLLGLVTTFRFSSLGLPLGGGDKEEGLGDRGDVGELGSDILLNVDAALPRESISLQPRDFTGFDARGVIRFSQPIKHLISPSQL